ncbi:hypothetical protein GGP57_003328 [Salinibacter ruber]|nr:hypothetical protein [Salinibacter ruber]MCS3715538.1 hypothetical protein [Salinibacter ruber]
MIRQERHHFLKHRVLGIILLFAISRSPKPHSYLVREFDC